MYSIYSELARKQKLNQNQTNGIEVVKLATKLYPYVDFSRQKRLVLANFEEMSQEILIKKNILKMMQLVVRMEKPLLTVLEN